MSRSIKACRKRAFILRTIQEIFLHDITSLFTESILITVTNLELTNNNRLAHVYLSFVPSQEDYKMFQVIDKHKSRIQALANKKLAHKLYTIPKLKFYLDHSIERLFLIERLVNGYHTVSHSYSLQTTIAPDKPG